MRSLLKKFKEGLARTVAGIAGKTHGIFGGKRIDAAAVGDLEEALITADFGVATTAEIVGEVKEAYRHDPELKGRRAAEIGAAVLRRVLAGSDPPLPPAAAAPGGPEAAAANPTVIILIGVNGSGKTTTCAKLAWRLKQEGRTVMVAAADTFRAAAIEQLKTWAQRLELDIISSHTGADAASVAFDAWQAAKARPGHPHCRHRRPPAHEGQFDGGAGEDPARPAKK